MFKHLRILLLLASLALLARNFIECADSNLDWWQKAVFYQIYPRSFKDSDGDGLGDLKGIESKLDHFRDIGVDAIWLSPIYQSPMVDFGYDISNFTEIYPKFGTMEDFQSLRKATRARGIYLVLDFVPNHSSDQHIWFKKSVKRIDPYTDYYIWKDPVDKKPPNNWISLFQGSAWEYNQERGQYYLHQFAVEQPDLNYRSPQLREEMKNVLRFFLDRGVDGFRCDAVPFLFEDKNFPDEPVISNNSIVPGYLAYTSLYHIYTMDLPETYQMLREFREVLDEYKAKDGQTRVMLTEAYTSLNKTLEYYGKNKSAPIAHVPFNFQFIANSSASSSAYDIDRIIKNWLNNLKDWQTANWVIGNHDNSRVATKYGTELADTLNIIIMLLPGVAITYNGEEIGMTDTFIRYDQTRDPQALAVGEKDYLQYSRDPERTPYQWNSSLSAGFSSSPKTWLPVNPNYWRLNLENEKKENRSVYSTYKAATKLRTQDVFRHGKTETYVISEWIFAYTRTLPNKTFVVIANIGSEEVAVNLHNSIPHLQQKLQIYLANINSEFREGSDLNTETTFTMKPKSSLVLGPKSSAAAATISSLLLVLAILLISLIDARRG